MGFDLKQEKMNSIAPMALAHPSIPLEAGRQNTNGIETQPGYISTVFDQYQTMLGDQKTMQIFYITVVIPSLGFRCYYALRKWLMWFIDASLFNDCYKGYLESDKSYEE